MDKYHIHIKKSIDWALNSRHTSSTVGEIRDLCIDLKARFYHSVLLTLSAIDLLSIGCLPVGAWIKS